jgi:hypothetical protein
MKQKAIDVCRAELQRVDSILAEREGQHGDPKENLDRIAVYWSNYLNINLTRRDVTLMMMLMKMGRLNTGTVKSDSLRDLIGYAALATGLTSMNEPDDKEHENE